MSHLRSLAASKLLTTACAAGLAAAVGGAPAAAYAADTNTPDLLGTFRHWRAATFRQDGQKVCYAFTDAVSSHPKLRGRGAVALTVAIGHGGQDDVALHPAPSEAGKDDDVTMTIGQDSFPFYMDGEAAFARDGHAVVPAFKSGMTAVAHWKAGGQRVSDTFSLMGFTDAYEAASKECAQQ